MACELSNGRFSVIVRDGLLCIYKPTDLMTRKRVNVKARERHEAEAQKLLNGSRLFKKSRHNDKDYYTPEEKAEQEAAEVNELREIKDPRIKKGAKQIYNGRGVLALWHENCFLSICVGDDGDFQCDCREWIKNADGTRVETDCPDQECARNGFCSNPRKHIPKSDYSVHVSLDLDGEHEDFRENEHLKDLGKINDFAIIDGTNILFSTDKMFGHADESICSFGAKKMVSHPDQERLIAINDSEVVHMDFAGSINHTVGIRESVSAPFPLVDLCWLDEYEENVFGVFDNRCNVYVYKLADHKQSIIKLCYLAARGDLEYKLHYVEDGRLYVLSKCGLLMKHYIGDFAQSDEPSTHVVLKREDIDPKDPHPPVIHPKVTNLWYMHWVDFGKPVSHVGVVLNTFTFGFVPGENTIENWIETLEGCEKVKSYELPNAREKDPFLGCLSTHYAYVDRDENLKIVDLDADGVVEIVPKIVSV